CGASGRDAAYARHRCGIAGHGGRTGDRPAGDRRAALPGRARIHARAQDRRADQRCGKTGRLVRGPLPGGAGAVRQPRRPRVPGGRRRAGCGSEHGDARQDRGQGLETGQADLCVDDGHRAREGLCRRIAAGRARGAGAVRRASAAFAAARRFHRPQEILGMTTITGELPGEKEEGSYNPSMYELLKTINEPAELRKLDKKQLQQLADELRAYVLDSVSKTGGHLSSNLGTVELTIALHYVYDTPEDRIVWD